MRVDDPILLSNGCNMLQFSKETFHRYATRKNLQHAQLLAERIRYTYEKTINSTLKTLIYKWILFLVENKETMTLVMLVVDFFTLCYSDFTVGVLFDFFSRITFVTVSLFPFHSY